MKGFLAILTAAAVALAGYSMGQSSIEKLNDCPGGQCQRTIPFNTTTAPIFDAPPAVGTSPVVDVVVAPAAPVVSAPAVPESSGNGLKITDEQKEALKGLFFQLATLAVGLFLGRGTTSPIVSAVLTSVLEFLKSRQPAAPKVPAASRRTRRRKA